MVSGMMNNIHSIHSPPKVIADIINTEEDEMLGEYQE
jgi:hypothetical protein